MQRIVHILIPCILFSSCGIADRVPANTPIFSSLGSSLGQHICSKEGEKANGNVVCCSPLTRLSNGFCTACGDARCISPEDRFSCPLDCAALREEVEVYVRVDPESINEDFSRFTGTTTLENMEVSVTIAPDAKFFRTSDEGTDREYFSKEIFLPMIREITSMKWPAGVRGIRQESYKILAHEVFIHSQ
jgi:hypothetical protein